MTRHWTAALTCLLLLTNCGLSGGKSEEGYTFNQLMDGVEADPTHYEVTHECVESNNTADGSIEYIAQISVTNTDDRQRSFAVRIKQERFESAKRYPGVWLQPGETDELTGWIGWKDDFPDGCPDYELEVYQNAAEALVEGNE